MTLFFTIVAALFVNQFIGWGVQSIRSYFYAKAQIRASRELFALIGGSPNIVPFAPETEKTVN